MTRKLVLVGALVLALGGLSAGIAAGGGGEQSLVGSTLERATAAALEHTGGGTVTETETGDDGAAYGIEVRLGDGTHVEVELDENFDVIGQEADDDGRNDEDGPNDN